MRSKKDGFQQIVFVFALMQTFLTVSVILFVGGTEAGFVPISETKTGFLVALLMVNAGVSIFCLAELSYLRKKEVRGWSQKLSGAVAILSQIPESSISGLLIARAQALEDLFTQQAHADMRLKRGLKNGSPQISSPEILEIDGNVQRSKETFWSMHEAACLIGIEVPETIAEVAKWKPEPDSPSEGIAGAQSGRVPIPVPYAEDYGVAKTQEGVTIPGRDPYAPGSGSSV